MWAFVEIRRTNKTNNVFTVLCKADTKVDDWVSASHWAKPKPLSFHSRKKKNHRVDFQAGERVGALEALYSLIFGVQRPPLSQILKIHLRGRKMPLGAYDRRCKLRNMAWLRGILRCRR